MTASTSGSTPWLLPALRMDRLLSLLSLIFCLFSGWVSADCDCGYSSKIGGSAGEEYVFTDLIESNFAHVRNIADDTDWVRQAFNLTNTTARGKYGEMFNVNSIAANAATSGDAYSLVGDDGRSAGLELTVSSKLTDDMVPVAEIDTKRLDVWWGTFRASMKMTNISGTCAAFFWYFNNTQEIDIEFLSKDFHPHNNSYPVNLVLQSREAAESGYNAQVTGNFVKAYLPFNPTLAFHEYRIDFIPGHVFFYADGHMLAEMNGSAVPTSPGHLILQHWSNGNPLWSGGPPAADALLTVNYVKAYFNTSTPERQRDWAARCRDPATAGAVCAIPDFGQNGTGDMPHNSSDPGFFFSNQPNMTNNQTLYIENRGARLGGGVWALLAATAVFYAAGWILHV